jgi:hypothetical protein
MAAEKLVPVVNLDEWLDPKLCEKVEHRLYHFTLGWSNAFGLIDISINKFITNRHPIFVDEVRLNVLIKRIIRRLNLPYRRVEVILVIARPADN